MRVIKSKGGYFYKIYKNGKKKRISKDDYTKLKSKSKKLKVKPKKNKIKSKVKKHILKGGDLLKEISSLIRVNEGKIRAKGCYEHFSDMDLKHEKCSKRKNGEPN